MMPLGVGERGGDEGMVRDTLDAAVSGALSRHEWAVLDRRDLPDGRRWYEIVSIRDETGTITIGTTGGQTGRGDDAAWRSIDPDRISVEVAIGRFPGSANAQRTGERLNRAIIGRLRELRRTGHAPLTENGAARREHRLLCERSDRCDRMRGDG